MTGVPTTNYGFSKIDFNSRPWDSDEHANWDLLDAILYTLAQVPNIAGVWRNSTQYQPGQNVLDPNTLVFYNCLVTNVSAATGSFAADRTANPANWTLTNPGQGSVRYDMGQALSNAQILQAQNNLALFSTFLRFDAPQTLTYNNMLQALNTLGIDGLETGIASAATTDISNVNTQAVAISGTTQITSFGARPNKYKLVRFTGSLRLVNSSTLNLPGGANITTQPGDTCVAFSDSATPTANWTIRGYIRADGSPLAIPSDVNETLKSALIQISKLRGTALGLPNYLSDDFNDTTGIDTANAVNATVSAGTVQNLADPTTKALLHFDGNLNDATGKTFTLVGSATTTTAQFVFGTSSLQITGGTDAITTPTTTDFGFGTGDFSIQFRFRPTVAAGITTVIDLRTGSTGLAIVKNTSGSVPVLQVNNAAGSVILTGTTTMPINNWYDIELSRASGTLRLFISGTLDTSTADSTTFGTSAPLVIGNNAAGSSATPCFIDEFRVSNIARHIANFTPTAAAFTYVGGGVLTLPSVATTAAAVPTRASMYALVKQATGTININTNMIFSATRDGGTTYTQFNLSVAGNYNGYTIYEQNVLDISAQPSGTSMKYKVITNDAALGVSIDAVLFQWG